MKKQIDFRTETLRHILNNGNNGRPMFSPNVISRLEQVSRRLKALASDLNKKGRLESDAFKSLIIYRKENEIRAEIGAIENVILLIGEFYSLDESKWMQFNLEYINENQEDS